MAYAADAFEPFVALVCLLDALLLQIGSNLANDVFDYEKGADEGERLGPMRVTQAGLLSPKEVKRGMLVVFGLAAVSGSYLIIAGGWPILVLGVAAILSAIAYTGGPYPLGYYGFGDLFVFLFFGLAAVAGTYYLQTMTVTRPVWWLAVAMGLLTTAILVVNNLRDIDNDRRAGKRTLPARFGARFAQWEYTLCVLGAYVIVGDLAITGSISIWTLLVFLTFPTAVQLLRSVRNETGRALNKTLARTGKLELFFGLAFAVGMIIGSR